jgi:hypothetical protein
LTRVGAQIPKDVEMSQGMPAQEVSDHLNVPLTIDTHDLEDAE